MNRLMFVDWHAVNTAFVLLCWLLAVVLAVVLLVGTAGAPTAAHTHRALAIR
jgi:hypothetical protein